MNAYSEYKELFQLINSWGGRIIETDGDIYYMGRNDFGQTLLKNKRTIRTIRRKGMAQKVATKITWNEGLHFVNDSCEEK